jgi:tetratricopeptide (TPR) repeat protein
MDSKEQVAYAGEVGTTIDHAGEPPTTAGVIALLNLQSQIDGQQWQAAEGRLTVSGRAGLIELINLRGNILGHIADYEQAAGLAEELVHDAPADGLALFARARTRATFHRFTDALSDLDEADRLGVARAAVLVGERAAIFQALGRFDEAGALRQEAAERRPDFETLGALAVLHAERGETAAAERLFGESRHRYRGISPFPLAMMDFQRGRMWMEHEDLHCARVWFDAARRRLPDYAPAQGHLAEVEAALGEHKAAVIRLRPLTTSTDDPDYAAQFARILGETGRTEEAQEWCARAAARYDELIARHPEAFADHAAEFWLTTGLDPTRALALAKLNLDVRRTPRAIDLLSRARRNLAQ